MKKSLRMTFKVFLTSFVILLIIECIFYFLRFITDFTHIIEFTSLFSLIRNLINIPIDFIKFLLFDVIPFHLITSIIITSIYIIEQLLSKIIKNKKAAPFVLITIICCIAFTTVFTDVYSDDDIGSNTGKNHIHEYLMDVYDF